MRRVPGIQFPRRVHVGTPLVVQRPRLDDGRGVVVRGNFVWGDQETVTYDGPEGHVVSLPLRGGSVVLIARQRVVISGNGYAVSEPEVPGGEARRFTRDEGGGWLAERVEFRDLPAAPVAGSGKAGNGVLLVREAPLHVIREDTRPRAGSEVRTVIRPRVGGA